MKPIEIWHDELRRYGVTANAIKDGAEFADANYPLAAALMRMELPEDKVPAFKQLFADMAKKLYGNHLKKVQ